MVIREILKIAKDLLAETQGLMEPLNYKTYEYETLMFRAEDINKIVVEIESCLQVFEFERRLDYREDTQFYLDSLQTSTGAKTFEILKYVEKDIARTILWVKKLSWLGEWDLNFDGQHTLMSIVFVPDPAINEYQVPQHYFWTGNKITKKNFKLELKLSEAELKNPGWITFADDWEKVDFSLMQKEETLRFIGSVFKWDKSKFSGFIYNRPFYAERITEFFGKNNIIYYRADKVD